MMFQKVVPIIDALGGIWVVSLVFFNGVVSYRLVCWFNRYINNWYEDMIIKTKNKKGRYGDTQEFKQQIQAEVKLLEEEKKNSNQFAALFVFCIVTIGELLLIAAMASNDPIVTYLNDTLNRLTSFEPYARHEYVNTIVNTMANLFSPGLNLGFIALLVLSIIYHEHPVTPMMGVLAAYLGGYVWLNNVNVLSFLLSHWLNIIVYAVVYVVMGALWTVPKWWIYVRKSKSKERLQSDYTKLLDKRGRSTVITDADKYNAALTIVSENKYKFYIWMMWWPFNVIYTFASDPLTMLYNWLYDKLTSTFARILIDALSDPTASQSPK